MSGHNEYLTPLPSKRRQEVYLPWLHEESASPRYRWLTVALKVAVKLALKVALKVSMPNKGLVPREWTQSIPSVDAKQGPRLKGMGSVHPKCRCQTRASPQGNGFSPSQVSMPNKGLVPRESVRVIPSVDAKQGPRPCKGIGSVHAKCRCQTRASSQANQFRLSQVSMPNKGLVPRESVQVIPSVDAKQGPRPCKGIGSVHPKWRCQTRASSQANQFRLSQVSMPNKDLVPRELVQVIPSVDAKQGPRPCKGIGSVHPKCRCQTRASSQANQFRLSQVSMPNKGLVPSESVQVILSVDAKQGPRPKGISSGYPKCQCQTRASSQGNQFRLSQVSMPNKGLVPRESVQVIPSVDAKQGPRPCKGIGSVHAKCRCQTRASSQANQFRLSQVSMPNKGLVPRESVQVIPSVDAKQGPRPCKGIGSVHPKWRCQTRASSQANQFRLSQVSMPNKDLVPRELVQVIPSVDAKQGPRPCKGIGSVHPKCRCQTRASSQANQFRLSQVSMPNKGLVPSESVQVILSVDAKEGPRPKGISSGYPKCQCQTRASSQGNQFRLSQVSIPNKGLVPRESVRVIPSVDAKQGPRPCKGIGSVHAKCRCQTRASSQANQFRLS